MTENKKKRAPGAGVKASDGALSLARTQVRLDPETLDVMATIGDGNVSLGIREAGRRLKELNDTGKFSLTRHKKRTK